MYRRIGIKNMWKQTTNTGKIGNYVYGLAIPIHGSTYIIKYVGQASSRNINRCFQHEKEAEKYLLGRGTSNVKKVEMINYYASNGNFKIIIFAHMIPDCLLDTMENIYWQLADYGALLFTISQDEVFFENNLTNIANTHNNKPTVGNMVVKPMTVKQIESAYASKIYLKSAYIAQKLGTNSKVLYVLNRPGIQTGGIIGSWPFSNKRLKSIDWIVLVGQNDLIEYVFRIKDINFIQYGKNKGLRVNGLTNHVGKLKPNNGVPCFNVNNKGWNRYGRAFTYL